MLGPLGTVGLRIGLSALILLAAFRPRVSRLNAAQWRAIIPYGLVLGVMNMLFYFSLSRIPLGLAVYVGVLGAPGLAGGGGRPAERAGGGRVVGAWAWLVPPPGGARGGGRRAAAASRAR